MADEGWDTVVDDESRHRWVYSAPNGSEWMGPDLHKTRTLAIRAGKVWLSTRT